MGSRMRKRVADRTGSCSREQTDRRRTPDIKKAARSDFPERAAVQVSVSSEIRGSPAA